MSDKELRDFNLLVPFSIKEEENEEEETLTIEGFANWYGDDVDSDGNGVCGDLAGDAVVPTGIDLSVYKGNPQILWQHGRDCSIGKANKTIRKKQGLFVNATIYKGAMQEEDWFRIKKGLVTRFSIGFRTLAGEYREINGKSIFFITKSLLLEISIVTIPCSSQSSFNIIKALDDGSITSAYIDTPPNPTEENTPTDVKEDADTMKVTLAELLSVEEVEKLKSLGLDEDLATEKEISTKLYIDRVVAKAVETVKAELLDQIAASQTPVVEEAKEEEEVVAEAEEEVKEESEIETPEEEIDSELFKSVSEEIAKLKAFLSESK